MIPIDRALLDRNLLGAALGDPKPWSLWIDVLRCFFGLPHGDITPVTGQAMVLNTTAKRELWAVVGRSGGKSRMAAAIAVYVALFQQHKLVPGEVGFVLCLSMSTAQAHLVFRYALAFIEESPVLRQEIVDVTATEIRLKNNIVIAVHSSSFRSVRGRTLLCCVFDEISMWRDEVSANPDVETYRAVMPGLARTGGPLISISTPYRKMGLLYTKHRDYFGKDDSDVLVIQGGTTTFNPTHSLRVIEKALLDDPEGNRSEYEAEFRADLTAFLGDEDIERAVDRSRPIELPPAASHRYSGFIDPSGGRHDHMTVAICHREGEVTVIDAIRGHAPPFDPASVVAEFAALLLQYGVSEVAGDNYSAAWVETAFRKRGITYNKAKMNKSQLYLEVQPQFTRGQITIPDHPKLLRELRLLERGTHRAGRDTIDHGRNGSDDYSNALAGAAAHAASPGERSRTSTYYLAGGPARVKYPDFEYTRNERGDLVRRQL